MSGERPAGGFRHRAFFYADADELLAGAVPFVRQGVEAGEAVLVAVPGPRLELLRGNLDGEAEGVRFADMEELGRNPARIISAWWDFVEANAGEGRAPRGIGEPIWAGRSAAELDECRRHESLLNLAFAESPPFSLMCPYDTASLDDEVLLAAERSHPALSGSRERSAVYRHGGGSRDIFAGELERLGGTAEELRFGVADLSRVRRLVRERGRLAGLGGQRLDDLVLAASEVATNSLRHGGGRSTVDVGEADGALVCDFRDRGRFDQPLVGRRRPDPSQLGGRGLWIANQLCDLVQIRSEEAGSHVRLRMSV